MYQQITIKTLHKQGTGNAEIARQLGCHRNTVGNIIHREKLTEKQTRTKPSVFEPYQLQIKEYLDKRITNRRIYEILSKEYGIGITYVNLCKYIQKHFPKPVVVFGVQTVTPGEVAEIDFGFLGMLPGPMNKLVKTYGLAVVLGYSRVGYFAICYDQKLATLIRELTKAFIYFGGVPKRLKVDNMRTAIFKNQHYDLEFNQDFLEYASHYNTVITPCTPYHPEQKGIVESGIKYLQDNFVGGRAFTDSADLKQQLSDWMNSYANQRVHGTTRKVPMQALLSEEREKLQSLPDTSFTFFDRGERIVSANCHIHFENNYYSVPNTLIGKEVTVRWNEHLLRVIYQGECVALHQKSTETGEYVTQRSHLPDYKIYSQTEYQRQYEKKMADIGHAAHEYFRMLLSSRQNYWFRTVRIILGLNEKYGGLAVNASLKRALYYQVTDVTTIRNILAKKLYLAETEPKLLTVLGEAGQQERPESSSYRELSYYTTGI